MATGRMSNRQKMINMMYLVLLAILALNVSSEVLDAFVSLRGRLQASAEEAEVQTLAFVAQMKAEIDREVENQGKRDNLGLKDTLDLVHQRTQQMLHLLSQHADSMEVLADYDEELEDYRRKDELEANHRYWMGPDDVANQRRGNGQAASLRDSLDDYFRYLHDLYNAQIRVDSLRQPLALTQDPDSRLDPSKRWEEQTFEGPVMANLATLEALKVDVQRREKELFDLFNTRLGINTFIPDTVLPISAPTAREVVAGTEFQTRLFVGMSSKSVTPEFLSPSGAIQVEAGGNSAWLQVMADGASVPAGQTEGLQRYQATIRVPKATGGFQDLMLEETFVVRKPTISVTAAAIQRLYRQCGNIVNIDVPELGARYQPEVSATNATVRQAQDSRKKFMVIPRGNRTELTVRSQTAGRSLEIGQLSYRVVPPPPPQVALKINNQYFTGLATVPKNGRFSIKLVPDKDFAEFLPRDARYGASSVVVLLKDGLAAPRQVKVIPLNGRDLRQAQTIRMPREVYDARPGTRLYVRLEGIYRINYQGQRIPEGRLSEWERTFAMDIR